jgi:hypothetical protein
MATRTSRNQSAVESRWGAGRAPVEPVASVAIRPAVVVAPGGYSVGVPLINCRDGVARALAQEARAKTDALRAAAESIEQDAGLDASRRAPARAGKVSAPTGTPRRRPRSSPNHQEHP